MQRVSEWIQPWARAHERAFLTLVMAVFLAVVAVNNAQAWRDGDQRLRIVLAVTWALGLLFAAGFQLVRWRQGRLIIRDPEERERVRAANAERSGRYTWPIVGVAIGLAALGGDVVAVLLAAFGSLIVGFGPLVLYIAFVVRPDQDRLAAAADGPRAASPHEPHP
jgi:hypothetical protein